MRASLRIGKVVPLQMEEITSDMSMEDVDRLVRATTHPYPGAFFLHKGRKVIVWSGTPAPLDAQIGLEIPCSNGSYFARDYEVVGDD